MLIWGAVLIVLVLGLGTALMYFRRKFHPSGGQVHEESAGFSIGDLELLRREGQISDEEFKRLRRRALGLDTAPAVKDNGTLSTPTVDDDG